MKLVIVALLLLGAGCQNDIEVAACVQFCTSRGGKCYYGSRAGDNTCTCYWPMPPHHVVLDQEEKK